MERKFLESDLLREPLKFLFLAKASFLASFICLVSISFLSELSSPIDLANSFFIFIFSIFPCYGLIFIILEYFSRALDVDIFSIFLSWSKTYALEHYPIVLHFFRYYGIKLFYFSHIFSYTYFFVWNVLSFLLVFHPFSNKTLSLFKTLPGF